MKLKIRLEQMNHFGKVFAATALLTLLCANTSAQEPAPAQPAAQEKSVSFPEDAPMLRSDEAPRLYRIRSVDIHGVQYLNPEIINIIRHDVCLLCCL